MDDPLQVSVQELVVINQDAVRSRARHHLHVHIALLLHDIELFSTNIYHCLYLIMNIDTMCC